MVVLVFARAKDTSMWIKSSLLFESDDEMGKTTKNSSAKEESQVCTQSVPNADAKGV